MALSCSAFSSGRIFGKIPSIECGRFHRLLNKLEKSVYKESPLKALQTGRWVKFICGASFEDLAQIRNLSLVYALAGVDCIDCAADEAVVIAATEGLRAAKEIALEIGYDLRLPWLMVSINDDKDPHFRKAEFNAKLCPPDCPRPCERVCPASAISFNLSEFSGVISERCYGCGRCLPVCPIRNIEALTYMRNLEAVSKLLCLDKVDAVEIHTGQGHLDAFQELIANLASALHRLKLVAVSVPDLGDSMIPAMASMYESLQKHATCPNLWQLDGRPMSGDIGKGATRATVMLAGRVLANIDRPPGFLQLAGGTNSHTRAALKQAGLIGSDKQGSGSLISGIAFGGYARKIVSTLLKELEGPQSTDLEDYPDLLFKSVYEAGRLVWPIKLT